MPSKLDNYIVSHQNIAQRPWTPTKRRGPIAAEFASPGPAIVLLPTTFGPNSRDARKSKAPAFTFGIKHEDKRDPKTPGPGEYSVDGCTRNGKDWSQAAFVSARYREPEPFNTPSPCHYSPERGASSVKEQAPSYTFGSKVNDVGSDNNPSPAAYSPDKNAASVKAPCYTFGLKTKDLKQDITPPPTAYNVPEPDAYKSTRQPSFTLRPKTNLPGDKTPKPGPADYLPERVWINKTSTPSLTFGLRPSPYALSF